MPTPTCPLQAPVEIRHWDCLLDAMSSPESDSFIKTLAFGCVALQNRLVDLVSSPPPRSFHSSQLQEILDRAAKRSDISDHLTTLFWEAMAGPSGLMVELGVRGGESTFVLERVARLKGGLPLVSIDIEDCSDVSDYDHWFFVRTDDVKFAGEFDSWTRARGLSSRINLLFIDTSHLFDHTVLELKHWVPLLAEGGRLVFHDTNQRRLYHRRDGSWGIGWNNRGVMSAIEHMLDCHFNERMDFVEYVKGWMIRHEACCNGFTVMTRLTSDPASPVSVSPSS